MDLFYPPGCPSPSDAFHPSHPLRYLRAISFRAIVPRSAAPRAAVHDAVAEAKKFITRAISRGLAMGSGHGPTNHYVQVLLYKEREGVLRALETALEKLTQEPLGALIPEVRSNLGYALPGGARYEEIAAVPGRISQVGDRVIACRNPAFGASRHIARVIMAAMIRDPDMRSAMNIKYTPEIIRKCRKLRLRLSRFDRSDEPRSIKTKEGASLSWGIDALLKNKKIIPDIIYDLGDTGKEPMVRVIGRNPLEVAKKVLQIAH